MKTLFVDVILPLPLRQSFTYRIPRGMEARVQDRVRAVVQFGRNKYYAALIEKVHETAPQNYQAKYVDEILDDSPIIYQYQLSFWRWMASYYMCSVGEVLNVALPSGYKLSSETQLHIHPSFEGDYRALNDKEYLIAEALEQNEALSLKDVGEILGQKTIMPLIKSLIEKRVLISSEDLKLRYKPKTEDFVRLTPANRDEGQLEKTFNELARAPKQLELLMTYIKLSAWHTDTPREVKKVSLYKEASASNAQVKSLEDKGILEVYSKEVGRISPFDADGREEKELNEIQQNALSEIKSGLETKDVCLLHGVTSSGKTEIYIQLAREIIAKGEQVLFLVPEIALTTQLVNRLKVRFGDRLGVYHSKFNENERVEIWKRSLAGEYDIVIGARSTLFVPLANIGLIIVDEEHETSYKQHDPQPRYHARDAAVVLAAQIKAKVLLGSATPSIESYYNTTTDKFHLVSIEKRFGGVQLPEIFVADLKEAYQKHLMKANLTPDLYDAIDEALRNKEQVILFQNRRGFSPIMTCEVCGWSPECKSCDITLTYHKYRNQLSCHYCGYSISVPKTCGRCGSPKLKLAGFGTEKVEEDLEIFFPDHKVVRMDLDTTRSKNAYQRIISDFENGEIDILVGTQMITKGLDFERVGLVGILSADSMMSYPDFRAFERSYQLMTQVSGRAGRKSKRGKVIIQTFEPDHFIIHKVVSGDYSGMVKDQLIHRKQFSYPPFSRMIKITVKHRDQSTVRSGSHALAKTLRKLFGDRVLGPETPAIARIRNLYLENIIIKLPKNQPNREIKNRLQQSIDEFSNIQSYKPLRLVIDVDPV